MDGAEGITISIQCIGSSSEPLQVHIHIFVTTYTPELLQQDQSHLNTHSHVYHESEQNSLVLRFFFSFSR